VTTGLQERLASVLDEVMVVRVEEDGALTVHHEGTIASLRVVPVSDELELVSLSQVLAWDLKPDKRIRTQVAKRAQETMLGTITLLNRKDHADVMLRYNFPGTGLSDDALRMLVLMVLSSGVEVREAILR
jgi:hypothetical protein